jgi:hypothetical protein
LKIQYFYIAPPRNAGEAVIIFDPVDMYQKGRTAYQYLCGQRRVKLAPEIGFDTPVSTQSGVIVYDEAYLFNGSMERYHFKLIGKKEVYVPYNAYRATYMTKTANELLGPKHMNPDLVRWELHRVWVVEGTLRPGKRHIFHKRRLYIDEDSWAALASDNHDAHGNIYRVGLAFQVPSYDMPRLMRMRIYTRI